MAYSLCDVLIGKGVNVPEDICISGFDGVYEAKIHVPPHYLRTGESEHIVTHSL